MRSLGFFKRKEAAVFSPQKLSGLVVPLITPLNNDFSVDVIALKALTARLMNKGVKNFFVLNGFSEGDFLSSEQKALVVETVLKELGGKGCVLVGCFGSSPDEIISKVNWARSFSSICVVNVPPSALSRELEFVDFFDSLFTQTSADIVVYNNSSLFKQSIPALWLDNIINWERLVGVIDYSRSLDYLDELAKYSPLTKLFEENEEFVFDSLKRGFSGLCCLSSVLFPSYYLNLVSGFDSIDFKKIVRLESRINALLKLLPSEKKVQAFKYALFLQHLIQAYSFQQLVSLSEDERRLIEEAFSLKPVSLKA